MLAKSGLSQNGPAEALPRRACSLCIIMSFPKAASFSEICAERRIPLIVPGEDGIVKDGHGSNTGTFGFHGQLNPVWPVDLSLILF